MQVCLSRIGSEMYYNFPRLAKSLGITPAMDAVPTDHIWTVRDLPLYPPPAYYLVNFF